MKQLSIGIVSCIFAVTPLISIAETHQVTVTASSFSLNDLVIQPGDTVVWTYSPREQDCSYGCPPEVLHNVLADDQSFTSGPPAAKWVYQRTFDQPGEIPYYCEVHSAPGRDIKSFMNGRITVQAEVEIRVEDRAGNMSEPRKLEFEVGDFRKEDRFKPSPAFHAKNKLGQAEFGLLTEDENVGDDRFK